MGEAQFAEHNTMRKQESKRTVDGTLRKPFATEQKALFIPTLADSDAICLTSPAVPLAALLGIEKTVPVIGTMVCSAAPEQCDGEQKHEVKVQAATQSQLLAGQVQLSRTASAEDSEQARKAVESQYSKHRKARKAYAGEDASWSAGASAPIVRVRRCSSAHATERQTSKHEIEQDSGECERLRGSKQMSSSRSEFMHPTQREAAFERCSKRLT